MQFRFGKQTLYGMQKVVFSLNYTTGVRFGLVLIAAKHGALRFRGPVDVVNLGKRIDMRLSVECLL